MKKTNVALSVVLSLAISSFVSVNTNATEIPKEPSQISLKE
ncbi:hypothetical protein [Paenibacillus sp. N3.4]|nr:hypothetical protein [Paenibacillus sp. N3.4]